MFYTNGDVNAKSWLNHLQRVQKYNTTNELGQTVVNTANLTNSDGTAHKAYEAAPGTYLGNLIERKQRGEKLLPSEEEKIRRFWASNPTAGLATTGQLGGDRNARATANTSNGWAARLG